MTVRLDLAQEATLKSRKTSEVEIPKKNMGKKYSLARLWEKTDKWGSSLKEHTRKSSYAVPGLKRKFIFILNITKHCLFSKHLFAFRQWRLKVRGFLRSEQRERKKKNTFTQNFTLMQLNSYEFMGLGKIISHLKWIKNGNIFFLFFKIYIHTSTLTHVHPAGFNDQDCICVDGNRNQRPSGFNSTSVSQQMERSSPLYNIIEPLLYIYIYFL